MMVKIMQRKKPKLKNVHMKYIANFLILILLFVTQNSCNSDIDEPADEDLQDLHLEEPFIHNRDLLYGIGEPLYIRVHEGDVNIDSALNLMGELGIKSFRLWMEMPVIIDQNLRPFDEVVAIYKYILEECRKRDIVVIGMSHSWTYKNTYLGLPDRDISVDSDYLKWINYFENSWETMANLFPEINYWQIANETNNDDKIHKVGFYSDNTRVFSYQEKADITTDLLYYGSRGIHRANPNAKVVFPPPSPVANASYYGFENGVIQDFTSIIYDNIRSGEWPSTNPRDYFNIASWHPYYLKTGWIEPMVDDQWVAINHQIYNVFKRNEGGDIPVFLTEFGYSDLGNNSLDSLQAVWLTKALKYVKEDMEYVNIFNVFRLFDSPRDASWGGEYQIYFGLFHIDVNNNFTIQAKEKGRAYANFIGT